MHADVVGGNTEPEEKFGAEFYVGTLCMHAIERGAEENRSVCVCVCEGKRKKLYNGLCIMTAKKGTTLLHA